jgi:hypothetical protein
MGFVTILSMVKIAFMCPNLGANIGAQISNYYIVLTIQIISNL